MCGGGYAGIKATLVVEALYALMHSIGYYRYAVVAYHAPVFIGRVAPHGQHFVHALVVVGQHRVNHIGIAAGPQYIEEGV